MPGGWGVGPEVLLPPWPAPSRQHRPRLRLRQRAVRGHPVNRLRQDLRQLLRHILNRQAGLLRELLEHVGPEHALQVGGRDGLVRPGADPRLRDVPQAVLLEPFDRDRRRRRSDRSRFSRPKPFPRLRCRRACRPAVPCVSPSPSPPPRPPFWVSPACNRTGFAGSRRQPRSRKHAAGDYQLTSRRRDGHNIEPAAA